MASVEKRVVYFEKPGNLNTNALLKTVREYAEKEGIMDIVVASTRQDRV